jgi:heterodisulfide reductase subunit B
MTHLDYYPGCTIKASAPQYERSALAVLRALGVEPREMDAWNCCGVSHSLVSDDIIRHVAPARVFGRLQQQGSAEVLTLCDMCYNTLSRANRLVATDAGKRAAINGFLDDDSDYAGQIEVLHLLGLLRDRVGWATIRKRVRRPLHGLSVFPYYGCKLLRPRDVGLDDAEAPAILRDLLHALGATVLEDPAQTQCCGAHHVVNREATVGQRTASIMQRARERGASAVALSCPLCMFNLDTRQPNDAPPLPVFYFTQLMSIAFGLERDVLGLEEHHTNPLPLLQAHALIEED